MPKTIITKKCLYDDEAYKSPKNLEKKFEQYIEKKVKKLIDDPDKYSFLNIISGDKHES